MDTSKLPTGLVISFGLGAAFVAQFLALMISGAGHGWNAPFFYSPALFLFYPIVLVRLLDRTGRSIVVDALMLVVAVILDVRLVAGTYTHESQYFIRYFGIVICFWILLWSLCQLLIVTTVVARLRRRHQPASMTSEL